MGTLLSGERARASVITKKWWRSFNAWQVI